MAEDGRIQIRSFRVVFELERRLHKIDRWRIPVPYGVPLRGIAYALGALCALLAAQQLPLFGELLRALPPPIRLVVSPVAIAYVLTRLRLDGRPAHAALLALARSRITEGTLSGFRRSLPPGSAVTLGELAIVADERSARYRRAVISGPANVVLRYPARASARGRNLEVRQASGRPLLRGKAVEVRAGQRLLLR